MKKIIAILVCVVMAAALFTACAAPAPAPASEAPASEAPASEAPASEAPASEAPASEAPAASGGPKKIGFYADGADSYYAMVADSLKACADADPEVDWTVDYKTGNNTAQEQLTAVEDFITAGYDAICVIQNNTQTTGECITKCVDAGIPYFGAGHNFVEAVNSGDAAGSIGYNFFDVGYESGKDMIKRGVKKVVNIQGVLGQGTAQAQSYGMLKAYEDAGLSLGGYTAEELMDLQSQAKLDGTQAVEVVVWTSGGWFNDPAEKAMTDAITSLGADGFDAVYAQNNPMMEGVLTAFEKAGLNPADYYLFSSNGREISWQWAKDGKIKLDVNHSAALEGDFLYQQIKAYFAGEPYRKYVHTNFTVYTDENINEIENSLVPFSDVNKYMEKRANGDFIRDINDPSFKNIEGYDQ